MPNVKLQGRKNLGRYQDEIDLVVATGESSGYKSGSTCSWLDFFCMFSEFCTGFVWRAALVPD